MATVGTTISIGASPATGADDTNDASATFLAGVTERGPVTAPQRADVITSYPEFVRIYGDRTTYSTAHDQAQCVFEEGKGAGRLYFQRVVGPDAETGELTLSDRAGSPQPTLLLTATSPGGWATGLTAQVVAGSTSGRFTLILRLGSDSETYANLTTPAAAVLALLASQWARGVDLGSATSQPNNNPAVSAAAPLTGGDDDRDAVNAAALVAALANFSPDLGPGAVAIPGQVSSAVGSGIGAHCAAAGRVGFVTVAQDSTPAQAAAAAQALRNDPNAHLLALIYPWVVMNTQAGGLTRRTIDPTGFAAGVRARTAQSDGVWQVPAGEWGIARFIVALERDLSEGEINTLADDAVSTIKANPTPRQYEWRSLGDPDVWPWLSYADLFNLIAWQIKQRLERFHAMKLDGRGHWKEKVAVEISGVLDPISKADGLYSKNDDGGYVIDMGESVNPELQIAHGIGQADVYIRPSAASELMHVNLFKVPLTAAL